MSRISRAIIMLAAVLEGALFAFAFSGCSKADPEPQSITVVQAEPVESEEAAPDYVQQALDEFARTIVSIDDELTEMAQTDCKLTKAVNSVAALVTDLQKAVDNLREQQLTTAGVVAELALKDEPLKPVPQVADVVEEIEPPPMGGDAPQADPGLEETAGRELLMIRVGDSMVFVEDFIARWYRNPSRFHAPKREELRHHMATDHHVHGGGFDRLDDETLRKLHIAIHEYEAAQDAPKGAAGGSQFNSGKTLKRGPFGRWKWK